MSWDPMCTWCKVSFRKIEPKNLSPKISGVFREKQRIEPEYAWSPRHNLEERAFILVGVFNLDPGYAYGIERSWRDLTGARTIYHHLYNEHDLCRILFLERTNKTTDIGKKNLKMRRGFLA